MRAVSSRTLTAKRFGHARRAASKTQNGFTLIELMVSLAIGLLVLASVSMVYVSASRTTRTSEMETQLNEDGVIALSIIQQQIQMAGYSGYTKVGTADKPNFTGAGVRGCSAGAFASTYKSFGSLTALDCSAVVDDGDGIIVRYEADAVNTVVTSAGDPTNCLIQTAFKQASEADATKNIHLAENRFFVKISGTSSGKPELRCAATSGTAASVGYQNQPLLENVERMQFRYGVAATNADDDMQVVAYRTAAQIDSLYSTESVDARWKRVVSVKVCLLMRSADPMKDIAATASYIDCDGTKKTLTTPDGYLRRSFITTAALRSRLPATETNKGEIISN